MLNKIIKNTPLPNFLPKSFRIVLPLLGKVIFSSSTKLILGTTGNEKYILRPRRTDI